MMTKQHTYAHPMRELILSMEQNKIWMRYLVLGVFSLFFVGFSCKKVEHEQFGEFIYINSTNHTINFFTSHFNSFKLLGLKTHVIKENQVAGKKSGPKLS